MKCFTWNARRAVMTKRRPFVKGPAMSAEFDIIVVGGGHAGTEAAAAAARMGAAVALVRFPRESLGAMSCTPALGGLRNGHPTREVDALAHLISRAAARPPSHLHPLNPTK